MAQNQSRNLSSNKYAKMLRTPRYRQLVIKIKNVIIEKDIKMNLSRNFTLQELIKSDTAIRLDINNNPNSGQIEKLKALCENILQPYVTTSVELR